MDIQEILEKLFGNLAPVCETKEDDRRYENLEIYKEATKFFIDELIESAKWKNDNRYSAKRIGKETYDFLESILEDLQVVIEQIDSEQLKKEREERSRL